jgi:hypothetical protein
MLIVRLWKKPLLRIALACLGLALFCAVLSFIREKSSLAAASVDSSETTDTLLPEDVILPDTSRGPCDTLLSDTVGLGRFLDSLGKSIHAGNPRFLRRHLSRGIQVGSSLGDRAGLVSNLRDHRRARLVLDLLKTTLSDGIRIHGLGTAPVASAPVEDPDSCANMETDLEGVCVHVRDVAVRWLDSPGTAKGSVGSRYVALVRSDGGDSSPVLPVKIRPKSWLVRSIDGRQGWIPSTALAPRDDPGLCLRAGKTTHGWRVTTLEVCGEDE